MLYIYMKIAIPVNDNKISSVMDFSNRLSISKVNGNEWEILKGVDFSNENLKIKLQVLLDNNIDLVICGVLSNYLSEMIIKQNIKILSGFCGPIEEVIQAYINNKLCIKKYMLPGCRKKIN
ncbi:MAG: hypothetical protein MJB14_15930 [Spirochaetes bacterium]|nr:hypothetical protein [Spirochaetota bacterium]